MHQKIDDMTAEKTSCPQYGYMLFEGKTGT
jgi:hypothetical protein